MQHRKQRRIYEQGLRFSPISFRGRSPSRRRGSRKRLRASSPADGTKKGEVVVAPLPETDARRTSGHHARRSTRRTSHTKLVAGRPPPLKAPLDYGRGPEKVWVYEALRVGDGQALTLTPRSRNTAGYLRLLEAVARANPRGRPLPLITDNLSSHKSPPIRECLEKHPRIEQVFIPVGACWLNLQEAWWRLFRREALAGHQTFADGEEIERAAQVATLQLNRRAKPWVWGREPKPRRYRRRTFVYRL
jgi:hypothetical protein